jgi:hypothetical protein
MRNAAFVLGLIGSILGGALWGFALLLSGFATPPSVTVDFRLAALLAIVVSALVGTFLSVQSGARARTWAAWLLLASGIGGFALVSLTWMISGTLVIIASLLIFLDKGNRHET